MYSRRLTQRSAVLLAGLALAGCTGSGATGPAVDVAGRPETTKTNVLETGAKPHAARCADWCALAVYLVGFHPLKDNPQHQFEAHRFSQQVDEDVMQCALYGNTSDPSLNGLEYIRLW
jgi:Protein of unknown function (DUF1264)